MTETHLSPQLIEAITSLDQKGLTNFVNAMFSPKEIKNLNTRFEIAQRLNSVQSQRYIAKEMGISTTTVCRVAKSLTYDPNSFEKIFKNN